MNPTVFSKGPYRFFFFSREEQRAHVHVISADGEAKFWLEPTVALANYEGLRDSQIRKIQEIVEANYEEIRAAWKAHFGM